MSLVWRQLAPTWKWNYFVNTAPKRAFRGGGYRSAGAQKKPLKAAFL
jgi:hypothetical protein